MNRRIPNGTYGGVGERGLVAPFYPIIDLLGPSSVCRPPHIHMRVRRISQRRT